ncbi:MAG: hypothetical protein LQ341_000484 [Variospora aurantia]|nr:MAG: hypothetical protein LQ341_000484 [Variospora aurantia]
MYSSCSPLITALATLVWIPLFSCAIALPSPACDSTVDGAKCIRAGPAAGNAGASQSLSIQAKPNLPEPYPWKVPGARSSQTLVFSRWGDELPFDDAREVIELGQTRISADMMIHHDVAMPRAKTWTVEAAQLFSMNDVGMDGMVHSEARRALEGLWSFGMQYGAYPECEIQLVDSLYTVHERGKFRLTKPVLGKA